MARCRRFRSLTFEATSEQALIVLVLPVHRDISGSAHNSSSYRISKEDVLDLRRMNSNMSLWLEYLNTSKRPALPSSVLDEREVW